MSHSRDSTETAFNAYMPKALLKQFGILLLTLFEAFGQWLPVEGVYGGEVNGLAVVDSNVMFVASRFGIYRSTTGGLFWERVSYGTLDLSQINAVGADKEIVLAGVHPWTPSDGDIYRSIDQGKTWLLSETGIPPNVIIETMYISDSTFLVSLSNGIYRSNDSGVTWTLSSSGLPRFYESAHRLNQIGDSLFATTLDGLFYTIDNGLHWIGTRWRKECFDVVSFDELIFITTQVGVYRSTDRGMSWNILQNGLSGASLYAGSLARYGGFIFLGTQEGRVFRLLPSDTVWAPCEAGMTGLPINQFVQTSGFLYAAAQNGIFRLSRDCLNWEPSYEGITSSEIRSFAGNGRTLFASSYGSGIFRSYDNGATWFPANSGLQRWALFSHSIASRNDTLFAGTGKYDTGGGVFRSTNNGNDWTASGLQNHTVLCLALTRDAVYAGTYSGGIFKSTNRGAEWYPVNAGLGNPFVNFLTVNGEAIFAGGYGGLFYSTNGGELWQRIGQSWWVYFIDAGSDTITVGTGGAGYWQSFDKGYSWYEINGGLPDGTTGYGIVKYGNVWFAATGDGVYKSKDAGKMWTKANAGLEATEVRSLTIRGGYLFAGTKGKAVWRRPLSELLFSRDDSAGLIPAGFSLEQNYPNPFNSTTTIKYSLPASVFVSITLFDIRGQKIQTLLSNYLLPGFYHLNFDASRLSSGTYFYRLQAGKFVETKKLEVLK